MPPDYAGVTASPVTVTTIDLTIPALSVAGGTALEGGSVGFVVTLSVASSKAVTVAYSTADGTAISPGDYTATDSSLVFQPRQTSRTVSVPVVDDALDEPAETFTLTLNSSTNATIQADSSTAIGTITDNDDAPVLSIGSPSVAEGESGTTGLAFVVTLTGGTSRQVTVAYADAGTGTATSGTDYAPLTPGSQAESTCSRQFAPTRSILGPERLHEIDPGGAVRRKVSRGNASDEDHACGADACHVVEAFDAKEQRRHEASHAEGT